MFRNKSTVRIVSKTKDKLGLYEYEWWGSYHKCPECKRSGVFKDYKYCPNCGIEIMWVE